MNIDSRWLLIVKGLAWSICIFILTTLVTGYVLGIVTSSILTFPQAMVLGIPWAGGATLFVLGPFVYMCVEHGRQTFVFKHREEWNKRELLEENVQIFVETFGGRDVESVMEELREKRLAQIMAFEGITVGRPAVLDLESATLYLDKFEAKIQEVVKATEVIEAAWDIANNIFKIRLHGPVTYYLGPKPEPSPVGSDTSMDEPAQVPA
jgi:hypothetical protein